MEKAYKEKTDIYKSRIRQDSILSEISLVATILAVLAGFWWADLVTVWQTEPARIIFCVLAILPYILFRSSRFRIRTKVKEIRKLEEQKEAELNQKKEMLEADDLRAIDRRMLKCSKERVLDRMKDYAKIIETTMIGTCLCVIIAIGILVASLRKEEGAQVLKESGNVQSSLIVLLGLAALLFSIYRYFCNKLQLRRLDLSAIELDIDVLNYKIENEVSYAEKTIRLHNAQLKRYYDMNLRQNSWIFIIGILCVFGGLGIIAFSINYVKEKADGTNTLVAVLGATGAILTNFIGVLYLQMHSKATDSLKEFHNKLVETHKLLVGNLVATRIKDDKLQDETFSELAKSIVTK